MQILRQRTWTQAAILYSLSLERVDRMKQEYLVNRAQHRDEAIHEARNPKRKH